MMIVLIALLVANGPQPLKAKDKDKYPAYSHFIDTLSSIHSGVINVMTEAAMSF